MPVDDYKKAVESNALLTTQIDIPEIEKYVRESGARVIARKGATFYAVAVSVCHICKCLLDGMDTTLTVSTMMHGEYGIEDVCLSTLNIIGRNGICGKINPTLTDEELAKLHKSADILKETIASLGL